MSIKLVVLKSGEQVIADTKEIVSEDKIKGYLLNKPQIVSTTNAAFLTEDMDDGGNVQVSLSPYILLKSGSDVIMTPDWVVTIVDPLESLVEMYEEKLNGENN